MSEIKTDSTIDESAKADAAPVSAEQAQETPSEGEAKGVKENKPLGKEILSWVFCLGAAVLIALLVRAFIFEPIRVDGNSMNDTLFNNQIVYCSKIDYIVGSPQRFDIVIVHYPNRGNTRFVKRIVGLPGDTVKVQDGILYVKGAEDADFTAYQEDYIGSVPHYTLEPVTLGEKQYFVLGDNRGDSNDSHIIGPLSRDQIIGHVLCVIWPLGDIHTVD
ncbi:MAG: signal peptidase I [Eubacteriales bacterium]|nr:signal peptidase I [Eubacteriales bacterium]MDD3882555.1 signal peptidase I [Eubacteriales bacterium]MDD4512854.1 signal peptidase I [Eubacteriales bacterium]